MSSLNFESQLESSISSVYYKVPYVARTIAKAQQCYDAGNDYEARTALEDAAALLRAAGEVWAARKVEYYTRFM